MTERDGLLAAVIADPADDTTRLAFADWLEENADPVRAAIIRAGVANPAGYLVAYNYLGPVWTFHGARGLQPRGTSRRLRRELPALKGFIDPHAVWFYYRGFLKRVRMSRAVWAEHGDTLRRHHPIEAVELADERSRQAHKW